MLYTITLKASTESKVLWLYLVLNGVALQKWHAIWVHLDSQFILKQQVVGDSCDEEGLCIGTSRLTGASFAGLGLPSNSYASVTSLTNVLNIGVSLKMTGNLYWFKIVGSDVHASLGWAG